MMIFYKKNYIRSILVAFVFSLISCFPALASDSSKDLHGYDSVECPRVPAAQATILEQLSTLKSQIASDARCKNVEYEMGELEKLIASGDRTKFLEIIEKNENNALSADETETLRRYSERVSSYSLKLVKLLQGNANCFPDDEKGNSLSTITSVVYEASSLLSKVAGPYGIPIAIGGNVLTGILTGIQKYQQSKSGFDFSNPQDRRTYTQQLCVFHKYRQEIDTVLYPDSRLKQMRRLTAYLEKKLDELKNHCGECKVLIEQGSSNDSATLLKDANKKYPLPLGTIAMETLQNKIWADQEVTRLNELRKQKQQSIGPQEILKIKKDLEYFFFEREAPNFLFTQFEMADIASTQFTNFTRQWTNHILRELPPEIQKETPERKNLPDLFHFLEEKSIENDIPSHMLAYWNSSRNRSADLLSMSQSAFTVVKEYCEFFQKSDAMISRKVNDQCNFDNLNDKEATLVSFADYSSLIRAPRAAGEEVPVVVGGSIPAPAASLPVGEKNKPNVKKGPPKASLTRNWVENFEAEANDWESNKEKYLKQ